MTTTSTVDRTAEALEKIEAAIHERLQEIMPDALKYAKASGQQAKIGIDIQLKPDKEIPDGWWVTVTPKLNVKVLLAEGMGRIERVGNGVQLVLAGIDHA